MTPENRAGPAGARVPRAFGKALITLGFLALLAGQADGLPGSTFTAPPAEASAALHTELIGASPEEDEVVASEDLGEIRLRFSTAVQLVLTRIRLLHEEGGAVEVGEARHAQGEDEAVVVADVPPSLPAGSYTVEWQTAGPDGHVIRGRFGFEVHGDPETGEAPPAPEETSPADRRPERPATQQPAERVGADAQGGPLGTGTRWLHLLAVALVVGTVAFRGLVLPFVRRRQGLEKGAAEILMRSWRLGLAAAIVGAASLPFLLWVEATAAFPEGISAGAAGTLLFGTPWGLGWLVGLVGFGLFLVGLVWAAPRSDGSDGAGWILAGLGGLALPFGLVLSGHVWATEATPRGLYLSGFYLHVLAMGAWLGGLAHLVLAGLPGLRAVRAQGERVAPGLSLLVNAFSRVAVPAVVLLVLSGGLTAWLLVETPGSLVTTGYGRALLGKIGLAILALSLGFYNWRVVRPSLEQSPSFSTLRIPATLEFLLGVLVLLLTALLVVQPLP